MVPQVVAAVILVFISSFVLLMSYVLGVCKEFSLIAGMDTSKVRDSDGLARLLRRWLLGLGLLGLLLSPAVFVPAVPLVLPIAAFAVLHLAGIVALAIRTRRYLV